MSNHVTETTSERKGPELLPSDRGRSVVIVWKKAANEMKVAVQSVWLYLVVVLASASQIRAQRSVLPPIFTSTSGSLGSDGEQPTNNPTDRTEITAEVTAFINTEEPATDTALTLTTIALVFTTQSGERSASTIASEGPSVTPTPLSTSITESPEHTFSSQPASTSLGGTPSVQASTEPLLVSQTRTFAPPTTGHSEGIAPGLAAGSGIPSQLNVGDEDLKGSGHRPNSLDPLLAGLLSVFIVTTAVVFVVLFLKFRHQNSNPEFHRLQDLPMDDLMEDTPLSRYTY